MFDYDTELQRYHPHLMAAADVATDDHILDIGCGSGLTTRDAARNATSGTALGVDRSPAMIRRARELATAEGVGNAAFTCADAQRHQFPPAARTLALSRFGTMFFDDAAAAFANIRQALRPGSRFAQLVWQGPERQEWVTAIETALRGHGGKRTGRHQPTFSLANPTVAVHILAEAGFATVDIGEVREPVLYGRDAADALDSLRDLGVVTRAVPPEDHVTTARAYERLLSMLEERDRGDGVWFEARAWLLTAYRP